MGVFTFGSGVSGCVCLMLFHSSVFLQLCPFAPLLASSSAASFPMSPLCPLMCSNLIVFVVRACCKSARAFVARYLLLCAVNSPVVIFAAYFES